MPILSFLSAYASSIAVACAMMMSIFSDSYSSTSCNKLANELSTFVEIISTHARKTKNPYQRKLPSPYQFSSTVDNSTRW